MHTGRVQRGGPAQRLKPGGGQHRPVATAVIGCRFPNDQPPLVHGGRLIGVRGAPTLLGRGNIGPVYPWFGQDARQGIPLTIENYDLLHRLWREDVVDWNGKFRTPLQSFTSTPRPLDGVPPFVWHGSIRSPEIAELAAYYGDGFFANHIFWPANILRV